MAITTTKRFDGKRYELDDSLKTVYDTKLEAQKHAEKLRVSGWLVRLVQSDSIKFPYETRAHKYWAIYKRRK